MPDFSAIPESKKPATTATNGLFFKPSAVPVPAIQKEDAKPEDKKPEEKKPEEKKETDTSIKGVFKELFWKLPEHYRNAYSTYDKTHSTYVFDLTEARKLLSNEITALWNVSNAIAYKYGYSQYKNVSFSDSIKIAESLSGSADTYLNLASLFFQKDIKKYLANDFPEIFAKNWITIVLTGLLIQGGYTAIDYATNKEVDALKIFGTVLTSYTDAPLGLSNPLQLDNIADPRWKTPFGKPTTDLTFTDTRKTTDSTASRGINAGVGFNFASLSDLYPKDDEAKKKYKGLEAYSFFNFSRATPQTGEAKDKYFGGIFIGDKGVYTLIEAGVIKGDLGDIEWYEKGGLVFKNFGNLRLLSVDAEIDQRPTSDNPPVRARINAATQIDIVDNKTWQFTLGGYLGGLLPNGANSGAADYGSSLQFFHKDYLAGDKTPYKTGVDLSFSSRQQDSFDANSQRLFTGKAALVFGGVLKVGLQYDQISGSGGVNVFGGVPSGASLPDKNITGYVGVDLAPFIFGDDKKKK